MHDRSTSGKPLEALDLSRRVFLGGTLIGAATGPTAAAETALPAETFVDCTLNGQPCSTTARGEDSALEVLRERLLLTGTKGGCGSGACGACTMWIDGVPHAACVTPATALVATEVTTIEGVSGTDLASLHPVQRALLAEDAVRCGYCTPGVVMSGIAFYKQYRATRRSEPPSQDELSSAFAGHLCRCGSYEAIFRAVGSACVGRYDAATSASPVRPEALAKVTGQARYAVDVALDGLLEAVIVRAPYAHARLSYLDEAPALDLEGVKYVLRLLPDGGRVRYHGAAVAAVAATDRRTAERGARRVRGEWEVLPAVTSMEAALAPGALLVFASRAESEAAPVAGRRLPATWDRNLRGPVSTSVARPGAARKGLEAARESGVVGEGIFRIAAQASVPLEPPAVVARWPDDDHLELWVSTEAVQELASEVSTAYHLGAGRCTVLATFVGGGAGTKRHLTPEIRAAIDLAKLLRAPVRIALDRTEDLAVGPARAAAQTELAVASTVDGALLGVNARTYSSAGAAVGNLSSYLARFLYATHALDLDDYDVVSHTPPSAPMRGAGAAALFFALESAVDQVAEKLNVDPIGLRRSWDPDPVRQALYTWASSLPVVRQRGVERARGRYARGVGIAMGAWPAEWDAGASVEIEIGPDGVVVRCGTQDAGEGTGGLLAAAVAARLGVPAVDVRVEIGDSGLVYGPPSVGGRQMSLLAAVDRAAGRLIEDLARRAADKGLGGPIVDGGVQSPTGFVRWRDLAVDGPPLRAIGRRGQTLQELSLPRPLTVEPAVASALTVAQVEVDLRLARVRVLGGWVGVGAGSIVVPQIARSQVADAFIAGVGHALTEERRIDRLTGRVLSYDFDGYLIAGSADAPRVEVYFEEGVLPDVRGGALDVSEVAGAAVPAAIANAVYDAVGRRPVELPLTPRRLLELLA